jgi:CheY-like chemotaxis protein
LSAAGASAETPPQRHSLNSSSDFDHDAAFVRRREMTASSGCPILIVEDDEELREMMVAMLALEGFEPASARDGIEALDHLRGRQRRPHVIVLDMMMPRMDGWEFCRQRQQDPALHGIPVVVLSAAPADRLQVPVEAVVPKPFDYDKLLSTIRAHCC